MLTQALFLRHQPDIRLFVNGSKTKRIRLLTRIARRIPFHPHLYQLSSHLKLLCISSSIIRERFIRSYTRSRNPAGDCAKSRKFFQLLNLCQQNVDKLLEAADSSFKFKYKQIQRKILKLQN